MSGRTDLLSGRTSGFWPSPAGLSGAPLNVPVSVKCGGGGCGGPAYGIFTNNDGGLPLSEGWATNNTFMGAYAGGTGGIGGFSVGNNGANGTSGTGANTNF